MKINAVVITALLSVTTFAAPRAQNAQLLQKARQAYAAAQALEANLNQKSESERTHAEYLKVISAYQKTYVITPHTALADDALMNIARLYEQIKDTANAMKT